MVESQNTKIEYQTKANYLGGFTSHGDLLVGNRALEYYNERNVRDFIQIPYTEIKMVTASVFFKKKITRFAIHTKKNGDFIFNSPDNKAILRALNKYLPDDKLRRSLTVWDYLKRKFKK